MSIASENEPIIGQEEVGKGPGARLREARERVGFGLEDVAAQLHLDRHTVESLESDRFDALPAPTFVRGYLRAYARLLDLPHAPIIEAFDRRGLEPPALIADIATGSEARSTDLPMRIATYGITAVIVVLAVLWWRNQTVDEGVDPMTVMEAPSTDTTDAAAPEGANADSGPTVATNATLPLPDSLLETQSDTTMPAPSAALLTNDSGAASDTPAASPPSETETPATQPPVETEDQSRVSESIPMATILTAPTETNEPPSSAAVDSSTASGSAVPIATAAASNGRIVLRFQAESWVEIYDQTEARLFFNMAKPGRQIDVSGVPPLRVLIGYVEGVEMEYNGRPYDFSASVRKGVARFQVGQ
ncbi:MAG: RodZ domain-containing protein [Pseudomonadota bacterium]